jgi:hypothetical protein
MNNRLVYDDVIDGQPGELIDTFNDNKPTRDQFVVGPYQVQHLPTGAKFGAYPGEGDIGYISWGLSKCCATKAYRDELQRIARELLRERTRY